MVYFLWVMTIPIGGLWLASPWILSRIVPDPVVAALAGRYLSVLLLGAPGYAAFESGKRFLQAQGVFDAILWVLLIGALLNALLNWTFVWVGYLTATYSEIYKIPLSRMPGFLIPYCASTYKNLVL